MRKTSVLLLGAICFAVSPAMSAFAAKKPAAKPAPAAPANPSDDLGPAKSLGSAGSWTAYLAQSKAGKVCYLVGHPERTEPAGMKRKTVMAMVTHRTHDPVSDVASFDVGYPLNEANDVVVEAGANKFTLFGKDDTAWARTADLDKTIVASLGKEKRVVVKAAPKKGHATTDIYSLAGFSKALSLIDKACDIKR